MKHVYRKRTGLCGLAASMVLASAPAWSQDRPAALTLCHEDAVSVPLLYKDKPGYSNVLIDAVSKDTGTPIKLVAKTWKDCLADVKAGTMDGAINGSYSKERAEFADYPVNIYGEPDPSKRMHRSSYALYRVKGASVGFDGKQLVNAAGVIAAPTGYSVIGQLKQLNAKIDDSVSVTADILKKVVDGQVLAGALIAAEADDLLRKNPELQGKIERVMPLLSERPYFTLLSKQFTAKYPRFSREFWRAEGRVRSSAEFQKRIVELQLIAE